MQRGGQLRASGKDEAGQVGKLGVVLVDQGFEAFGLMRLDAELGMFGIALIATRNAQIGPDVEKIVLDALQGGEDIGSTRLSGCQRNRQADRGVGLIHRAVRFDSYVIFGDSPAGSEAGCAIVARFRVYLGELDHGSMAPRASGRGLNVSVRDGLAGGHHTPMNGATETASPAPGGMTSAAIGGMTRRWKIARAVPPVERSDLLPIVRRVLSARGMTDPGACDAFLDPTLKGLHSPTLLPGVERATERLLEALRRDEQITIYGDYDVDGVTATVVLYRVLKGLKPDARVTTFVPHRVTEGYGLHSEAMDEIAASGSKVVVSVDCGITAHAPAQRAKELGLDLIITDHHALPSDATSLPDAFAIVHPTVPGSAQPFADLCGAGVAYKLAWNLCTQLAGSERVGADMRKLLIDLLAFVGLGVIADIVPLVDENRILARYGLSMIKSSPFVGLQALVEASGLSGESIDSERAGFQLAPRLNASGRMGHASEAIELFLTDDDDRAKEIAERLNSLNRDRQKTERAILDQAQEMAEAAGLTSPGNCAIVLAHEQWHTGVVGIVCSRLVDRHCRPTLLLQKRDGVCCGSGRSIDGFNLHAALEACADLLETFGGHEMAAGLTVSDAKFGEFCERFAVHASEQLCGRELMHDTHVDTDAAIHELSLPAAEQLARLGPFGRGNPEVQVRLRQVRLCEAPRLMGQQGKHLSLRIANRDQPTGAGQPLRLVAWGWGVRAEQFATGDVLDVIVRPRISRWGGRVSVEGQMVDCRHVD